ncbi:hypothetical protein WDU94_005352 [Cyamophila willieti]
MSDGLSRSLSMRRQYASRNQTRAHSSYMSTPHQSYTRQYPSSSDGCMTSETTFDPGRQCRPQTRVTKCRQKSKCCKPVSRKTSKPKTQNLYDLDYRNPCPCCRKTTSIKRTLRYFRDKTKKTIQRTKTTWANRMKEGDKRCDQCCICYKHGQAPKQCHDQPPKQYHDQPPKQYHDQPPKQYHDQPPKQYHDQPPKQYHDQPPKQYHGQPPKQYHDQPPKQYHDQSHRKNNK